MILLDKIERIKIGRKQLKKLRERAIKAFIKIIRDKKRQYQLFKQKIDRWEEQLNEQFNRPSKQNDGRKRETSSEDTAITKGIGEKGGRNQGIPDRITESDLEQQAVEIEQREIDEIAKRQRLSRSNETEKLLKEKERQIQVEKKKSILPRLH